MSSVKDRPVTRRKSKAKTRKSVFTCNVCTPAKSFIGTEYLRSHQLKYHSAQWCCDFGNCNAVFDRPDLLARHVNQHTIQSDSDEAGLPFGVADISTQSLLLNENNYPRHSLTPHPTSCQGTHDINLYRIDESDIACTNSSQPAVMDHKIPSFGDTAIIWNSLAFHQDLTRFASFDDYKSYHTGLSIMTQSCELSNGCNEGWGNRNVLSCRAETSKLFDRNYVWFVTQTMVSIKWTLWTPYKVYPKSVKHH
ncbi:hypothetical protein HYFRA_00009615 [Hymenoscyphus fraxineus]|uniref:C2H2-type domain-containing protein n=1 Tax=Hymenoscyphus fraxineus TaxID=746836 RepID=A0A9N9KVZ6_9HELO|nr:hypothetical protein HYFRA_00009615 [Hymenoscyphus fraxineus]